MKKSDYLPYLRTLRRVPDDVILSVATRDLDLDIPNTCLCGWIVRESIARMTQIDASDAASTGFPETECETRFGGSYEEWSVIFWGVTNWRAPYVERAFVERVLEAV